MNISGFLAAKLSKLKPFILTDLGFENMWDWAQSCMGAKAQGLSFLSFISFAGISAFVQRNIWEEPQEIYFLLTLIGIDLFTGIWKSIKNGKVDPSKKFRSRRISRTVGKVATYSILLYMAFNMDKNIHVVFFWMPYSFLGMFYATEAWSIIENLSELGFLNKEIVNILRTRLSIKNLFNRNKDVLKDNNKVKDEE